MSIVTLSDDQERANNAFLDFLVSDENFFVIQGAAGTGKSFLIRHLLATFHSKYKAYCLLLQKEVKSFNISITATTNKAVSVVDDFLDDQQIDVCTIFSLLGLRVQNDRKTGKTTLTFNKQSGSNLVATPNTQRLIFIDEASFIGGDLQEIIDVKLAKELNAKVVYIGDQYQLAPVGQTFSVMEQLTCTKATLDKVLRNSGHILATGTQYRKTVESGIFMPIQYNGADVIHVDGPNFQQAIEKSFLAPDWTPNTSKVLAWTNERVQQYNQHIRKAAKRPALFSSGEAVVTNQFIHSKNYGRSVDSQVTITNIDQTPLDIYGVKGYMVEIDYAHVAFMPENFQDVKNLLKSLYKEAQHNRDLWKKYFEIKETWLDLRAVYSSSIHKAQGSTYETVFLDLSDIGKNWNAEDVARLMYVGVTRASKQVVCYGYLPDHYC